MHLADYPLELSPLNRPPKIVSRAGGLLSFEEPPQRVMIVGAGFGREAAPLSAPGWTVFALNLIPPLDRHGRLRADLWWDIHQRAAQTKDDLRWIGDKCPVPIFVPPDLVDAGPQCVRFPIEAVEAEFGGGYWTCTFAYQIAYAMMIGAREIALYGVELAYGTPRERTVEYACVSWWLGYAEAKGVQVTLPFGSRLGSHPHRYGLEYQAEIDDVNDLMTRLAMADDALGRHRASMGG